MNNLLSLMRPDQGRRFLFFGGKGGVGKTTMAAATAVWMAEAGYRTTIISTDPTVSLSAVFHQEISALDRTPITGVQNLWGVNINPSEATGAFQKRLQNTASSFSSFGADLISTPCIEEIAAFDQFVEFLEDQHSQVVVFDTAPTGHSLRELAMPFDWANLLKSQLDQGKELANLMGMESSPESFAHLESEKQRYDRAMSVLKDVGQTIFTLVLLPAYLPIEETDSAVTDLRKLHVNVRSFIVNQLIPEQAVQGNRFLQARCQTQAKYLDQIRSRFGHGLIKELEMLEGDVNDVDTLRVIGKLLYEKE